MSATPWHLQASSVTKSQFAKTQPACTKGIDSVRLSAAVKRPTRCKLRSAKCESGPEKRGRGERARRAGWLHQSEPGGANIRLHLGVRFQPVLRLQHLQPMS